MNGGVTYKDLEEWKRKTALLEEAVEYLTGRRDSEKLMAVYAILTRPAQAKR